MITVEDIMTRHPKTLSESDSLADARRLMTEYEIRHVPVLGDGGKLVGLVTLRDVLAASSSVMDESEDQRSVHDAHIPLSDVMTNTLDLVAPGAGLRDTAMLMRNHRHGCLPVMDNEQLVGIITDTDFVEVSIHLLEQLESGDEIDEAALDSVDDDNGF